MRRDSEGDNLARCSSLLQEELIFAEQELEKSFDVLQSMDPMYLPTYMERERGNWKEKGTSIYVYASDSLSLWSDNAVPDISSLPDWKNSGPCLLLGNGWYILRSRSYQGREYFGLILLKHEYKYQNKYLKSEFNPRFSVHKGIEISFTPQQSMSPIKGLDGEELFYLKGDSAHQPASSQVMLFVLSILGLIFMGIHLMFKTYKSAMKGWPFYFLLAIGSIISVFLVLHFWSIEGLDSYKIFDPAVFASNRLFPSLAHFCFFSAMFLAISNELGTSNYLNKWRARWINIIIGSMVFILIARVIDYLIRLVIQDSNVVLDVTDLFHWDIASLMALLAISFLLFSAWVLVRLLVTWMKDLRSFKPVLFFFLLIGVSILLGHSIAMVDMVKVLWAQALLLVVFLNRGMKFRSSLALRSLIALSVLALYASLALEKELGRKENRFLGLVAERLMETKDEMAENLFIQAEDKLSKDPMIWNLMREGQVGKERVLDLLREDHLGDYWSKYELEILRPDVQSLPKELIESQDRLGLFWATGFEPGLNYIMRFAADTVAADTLYVGFKLNVFPEELGFPELLQEGTSVIGQALNRYSMAYYIDSKLMDQFGEHSFPMHLDASFLEAEQPQGRLFRENGQRIVEFTRGEYTYLISRPDESWIDTLTTFTYLIFFLGLLMGLGMMFTYFIWDISLGASGLQSKVQVLVVSMVLGSLSIFGIGAYSYIISQNIAKNQRILGEKVDSVLIELSQKIQKEQALTDPQKLSEYLSKFSKVFFSDINLYDLKGNLMATSREALFNKGISSELMDAEAYTKMRYGETLFVHEEMIGGLKYLSAYVPFMDAENRIVAYLNLPYFAKQGELENELSEFLVAVVNVLILLFIISIIIGVMVSSWLTYPLQLLRDNLAQVKLGATNRPIEYEGTDEISSLVAAYNSKVQELQENAELLAKSERESAWREMAKQVAHEIKNPLTPMKLSIQYLQKSLEDKGPDWDVRFKRSTDMLIEQIDTLSGIATAFSDFAKMPTLNAERFDLLLVLNQVVDLFENDPLADVSFGSELKQAQSIWADKDQITRLFMNLIKNAVQSIPENQEGRVKVLLSFKGYQYIIEVKDNGVGIPIEMREKIFEPNFTTKSTGTGLGLAMCKNIVELSGGEIWFRTEVGKGSSFLVSLPAKSES
jgi:two-component system, NtrC family, nitrogen regulation sensor histidine kinase NtrY